jgi:hypothetical protein
MHRGAAAAVPVLAAEGSVDRYGRHPVDMPALQQNVVRLD